jgi:LacI family transcriptional regulator
LNGGPRGVSDEKRRRVLDAVRALGYRPNAIARSLRSRRTNILGLVLPSSASPYFAALAHAIEEAAAARGYQVVVANALDLPEREAAQIEALLRLRVDGLIWIPTDVPSGEGRSEPPVRPDVPTVQVDRALSGPAEGYDVIVSDNAAGGALAADHLLALGHRRVAVVSGRHEHLHARQRLAGARRRLEESGVDLPASWVAYTDFSYGAGADAAARWLALPEQERPTAIVAGNDRTAIGVLSAAAQAGVGVPEQLSVVGFNDVPQAAFTVPPLTTIAQPLVDIGAAAVARLLARIETPNEAPPPTVTRLPVHLVVRASTAPPA